MITVCAPQWFPTSFNLSIPLGPYSWKHFKNMSNFIRRPVDSISSRHSSTGLFSKSTSFLIPLSRVAARSNPHPQTVYPSLVHGCEGCLTGSCQRDVTRLDRSEPVVGRGYRLYIAGAGSPDTGPLMQLQDVQVIPRFWGAASLPNAMDVVGKAPAI